MVGTSELLDRLREEGFEASHSYVAYLLRERIISSPPKGPGGALLWSPANVAALRRELAARGRGPEACSEGRSR